MDNRKIKKGDKVRLTEECIDFLITSASSGANARAIMGVLTVESADPIEISDVPNAQSIMFKEIFQCGVIAPVDIKEIL